jgi:hypothetical protein
LSANLWVLRQLNWIHTQHDTRSHSQKVSLLRIIAVISRSCKLSQYLPLVGAGSSGTATTHCRIWWRGEQPKKAK